MSEQEASSTTNKAESDAAVGIQAESVHNSNVYMSSPEDPPERIYEVGVSYLKNGVPLRARELINDAIARGHENAGVWFHWALAMLSKRSYREMSPDERDQLRQLPRHRAKLKDDEWTSGLETLCELFTHLESSGSSSASALTKLRNLPASQREQITFHCDLVLTGAVKDSLWEEIHRDAQQKQHADDRASRVWAYFEPDPERPRVRPPELKSITVQVWIRTLLSTTLVVGAVGCIGWGLLRNPTTTSIVASCLMFAGGAIAILTGFEWHYQCHRLVVKEREYVGRFKMRDSVSGGGFADQVDRTFSYYAKKFAPAGADRSLWFADTRGIRAAIRDEIVEIYRDEKVSCDKIRWLIRFLVRDVKKQWSEDFLFSYRDDLQAPLSTKVWCFCGTALGVLAAFAMFNWGLHEEPLLVVPGMLIAVGGGRTTVRAWWHIASERRRYIEETQECMRKREARENEYRRWKDKLAATRPTDDEMESWLRFDRVLFINDALRHYRLAWRDITAHTVVQIPGANCKRARVNRGPWRHSRYELRLFLITTEGVRELVKQLDVKRGTFSGNERGHFRFDAVSSLHVLESWVGYTLELTLSNGPARTIKIIEPERTREQVSLDDPGLSQISLDSTGFTHALHVLEGIASEGKGWIKHEAAKLQNNDATRLRPKTKSSSTPTISVT